MTTLDLKRLSKGMHIKDKMRLLFEDMNRQAETDGKESVLTSQERDAILADARKNNEMNVIRRVNELYLAATYIGLDMELTEMTLYLSISCLERILMGVVLKSTAEEIVGEIIYDMARQSSNNPDEIDKQNQELRVKYKVDSVLFKGFDFFNPPEGDESSNSSDKEVPVIGPNEDVQKFFMLSYQHARKLKKKLYEMEYVIKQAPIDFLPGYNKKLIEDSEELLSLFVSLDSSLRPLRLYRDYGSVFITDNNLAEPDFLAIVKDVNKSLELTDGEKSELEGKIEKSVRDNSA